jgi:small subunit ribosomal protein S8
MSGLITDPVGDMLTRIRNANLALKEDVSMPSSRMKRELARILESEGYIEGFEVREGKPCDTLVVRLKYSQSRERVISGLKRVSKPGRRVDVKSNRAPKVLGGLGISVMSTSSGVLTGRDAQDRGLGGEVLCEVW